MLGLLQVSPRLYVVGLAQIRYRPIVPAGCAKQFIRSRRHQPIAGVEFGIAAQRASGCWAVYYPPTDCVFLKRHHTALLRRIGQAVATITARAIFKMHNVVASWTGK